MTIVRSKAFKADRPWGALDIETMNGITTRLHGTDQPPGAFTAWTVTPPGRQALPPAPELA